MQQDNRDKRRNDCLSVIRVIVYFEILPNSTCRLRFTTWYILLISGTIFVIGHRITVTSKFLINIFFECQDFFITDCARKSTDYAKGAICFWASVILWAGYYVIQFYGYACMGQKL